ncbi:MAG: prenyltransferase/squalene oxidase repeat-containing protein [Candidatus Thorarchaeota archaeon]|nr:prenyltransferase/squalene oxidase repeat-containing protein [Candidatus Thorarchaeota archaeon]
MKKVQIACMAVILALVAVTFISTPVSAATTRWDSLNTLMIDTYDNPVSNGEGGYSIPGAEASRLLPTYGAITIFNERELLDDRPPITDLIKVRNFTRKLQWKSGGEEFERYGGFSSNIAGAVNMKNSYYGVKLWQLLDGNDDIPGFSDLDDINATAALVFLNKTQSASGGFGIYEGFSPDLVSTYQALYILDKMTVLSGESWSTWLRNETATIEFILSCREDNGFKLSPSSSIVSLTASAAGLMALDLLSELSQIPTDEQQDMRNLILSLQDTDATDGSVGGFQESVLTNDTNLMSTYHALEAIGVLGGMSSLDASAISQFIADCQAANGGWGIVPDLEAGTLFYAGLALEALRFLHPDGTYLNVINEIDPNNPDTILIDWRILFVVIFIIAALVIALIALRQD